MAELSGLDRDQIASCLDAGTTAADVQAMHQEATQLGVTSTPSFVLNGEADPVAGLGRHEADDRCSSREPIAACRDLARPGAGRDRGFRLSHPGALPGRSARLRGWRVPYRAEEPLCRAGRHSRRAAGTGHVRGDDVLLGLVRRMRPAWADTITLATFGLALAGAVFTIYLT